MLSKNCLYFTRRPRRQVLKSATSTAVQWQLVMVSRSAVPSPNANRIWHHISESQPFARTTVITEKNLFDSYTQSFTVRILAISELANPVPHPAICCLTCTIAFKLKSIAALQPRTNKSLYVGPFINPSIVSILESGKHIKNETGILHRQNFISGTQF